MQSFLASTTIDQIVLFSISIRTVHSVDLEISLIIYSGYIYVFLPFWYVFLKDRLQVEIKQLFVLLLNSFLCRHATLHTKNGCGCVADLAK